MMVVVVVVIGMKIMKSCRILNIVTERVKKSWVLDGFDGVHLLSSCFRRDDIRKLVRLFWKMAHTSIWPLCRQWRKQSMHATVEAVGLGMPFLHCYLCHTSSSSLIQILFISFSQFSIPCKPFSLTLH